MAKGEATWSNLSPMERGIVLADVGLYARPDGVDVEQVDHLDLVEVSIQSTAIPWRRYRWQGEK